jgi:dipeptidyl aminopeptidase/acylaminoacyl peptidase
LVPPGGEPEHVTNVNGDVLDLKWSPDGNMIAFTARDGITDEQEKRRAGGADEISIDQNYRYARLWVLSLSDRKAELVTKESLEVSDFAWSPDSSQLTLTVSRSPGWSNVEWHSSLVVVRREPGDILRTLSTTIEGDAAGARWSPDGKTIAFLEFTPNRLADYLALVPAAGGPVRHLLQDYPGTVRQFEWAPDSKHLLIESNEKTKDKFLNIETSTGAVTRLGAETALAGADFSVSSDGQTFAYPYSSGDGPLEIWVCKVGGSPRQLTHFNPHVASWRLGEVTEVSWKSKKDGVPLYGVLVTPPNFARGHTYPTVVQAHGGPLWAWWSGWLGSWHEWAQLLASNGYVVFLPNPRGSTGRGWKFAEAVRDDEGGKDFDDIMDGLDMLIGQKIADPRRLGIGGFSYGGFMSAWTVTHTNRFKAAVVGAPITNWFSAISVPGYTDFLPVHLADDPLHGRADYDAHSPMTFLANCRTPSFVFGGDADGLLQQGWEFYNGLKMLGVPTEMVIYPREGHGLQEPAHQLDLLRRILAWYDRYLKQ